MAVNIPILCECNEIDFSANDKLLWDAGSGSAMAQLLSKCPRLQRVNVKSTGMNNEALQQLAQACPKFVEVNVFFIFKFFLN